MKLRAAAMDPLIEGYFSYLDKVGRKTPRTIQNCLLICWSTENADPCFEPALVNGACVPAMCARL
jgi:hypothetical protein